MLSQRQQLLSEINGNEFVHKVQRQNRPQRWRPVPAGYLETPPLEIKRSPSLYRSIITQEMWTFTQNDVGAASFCLSGTQRAKNGFVIQFASPVSDVNGLYVLMAEGELRVLRPNAPTVRSDSNSGQFTFKDLIPAFNQPAIPTGNTYLWFEYSLGTITIGSGNSIGSPGSVIFRYSAPQPLGGVMSYGFGLCGELDGDDSVFISDVTRVGL